MLQSDELKLYIEGALFVCTSCTSVTVGFVTSYVWFLWQFLYPTLLTHICNSLPSQLPLSSSLLPLPPLPSPPRRLRPNIALKLRPDVCWPKVCTTRTDCGCPLCLSAVLLRLSTVSVSCFVRCPILGRSDLNCLLCPSERRRIVRCIVSSYKQLANAGTWMYVWSYLWGGGGRGCIRKLLPL